MSKLKKLLISNILSGFIFKVNKKILKFAKFELIGNWFIHI